jgi:hypothetical protein
MWEGEVKKRRWRWENMVDQLHIRIQKRMMKPLAIALDGPGWGINRRRWWGWCKQCSMWGYLELTQLIATVQLIYSNKNGGKTGRTGSLTAALMIYSLSPFSHSIPVILSPLAVLCMKCCFYLLQVLAQILYYHSFFDHAFLIYNHHSVLSFLSLIPFTIAYFFCRTSNLLIHHITDFFIICFTIYC